MNRRTFCSLPLAGALAATPATPALSTPKTTIFIHDFALTREKVAVFDLDGVTYGLRWSMELEEDIWAIHSVDPLSLVRRFVETTTGGTAIVQNRIGSLPEYEEARIMFVKHYDTSSFSIWFPKTLLCIRVVFEAGPHNVFWNGI